MLAVVVTNDISLMPEFDLAHFTDPVEQAVMCGALDVEQLAAGTYRCTFVCQLSTGKELTVRDFTFTK